MEPEYWAFPSSLANRPTLPSICGPLAVLSNICFSRRLAKRSYATASMADSTKGWARMEETIVMHVEPGETLSEIAARHGVGVEALQQWNGIENPDLVLVGQEIIVYSGVNTPESSASGSVEYQFAPGFEVVGSWEIWVGGAIVLGLLLFLLCRIRGAATPNSRTPSSQPPKYPIARGQDGTIQGPTFVAKPMPAPLANDGERLVSSELMQHYRDWILIDDVLLPSGPGTTQIDHILVSPSAVFLIETKEMNGWVFGSPGQKQWTQSFAAGRWSHKAGIRSRQFKFYNPLLQNEGHAKTLVRLGIIDRWRLRPIVIFVGDTQLKTAEKFLPFDEHEKIASKNGTWRMRGVICMGLAELHHYIDFSVNASSNQGFTLQKMERIRGKIRAAEIPKTAESHAKHVDFVQSVKEMNAQ